ncbi:MAG: DUF3945 domain-containing protein, partial [Sphingobacteriaceae bacterium]
VIIIKTKKGRNTDGKVNITYKSTVSFDRVNKLPALQTAYGEGSGGFYRQGDKLSFGDLIAARSGGNDVYITNPAAAGYQGFVTFPDGSSRYAIASGDATNSHGGKNSTNVFDHTKDVFQTGRFFDNNLTLSGGDSKSTFLVSYGNLTQDGVVKAFSRYVRNNARVNVATRFNNWLKVSANVLYTKTTSQRNEEGDNVDGILLGATRTPADFNNQNYTGTYTSATGEVFNNAHVSYRNPLGKDLGTIYSNPIWNIYNNQNSSNVDRLTGTFELNLTPTSWLTLTGRSGIDNFTDDRLERFARNSANFLNGYLSKNLLAENQFNTDVFANATKTISNNLKGSVLLGVNYNSRQRTTRSDAITNLIVASAPNILTNALNSNLVASNSNMLMRTYAYYLQTEVEDLQNGKVPNVLKEVKENGKQKTVFIEFDKETNEFLKIDSAKVIAPESVNDQLLSEAQKKRFREGLEIELRDGTQLQATGKNTKGILSNRNLLVLSVLLDGGVSYLLLKGIQALEGKQKQLQYNKGYNDALDKVLKEQKQRNIPLSTNVKNLVILKDFREVVPEIKTNDSISSTVRKIDVENIKLEPKHLQVLKEVLVYDNLKELTTSVDPEKNRKLATELSEIEEINNDPVKIESNKSVANQLEHFATLAEVVAMIEVKRDVVLEYIQENGQNINDQDYLKDVVTQISSVLTPEVRNLATQFVKENQEITESDLEEKNEVDLQSGNNMEIEEDVNAGLQR